MNNFSIGEIVSGDSHSDHRGVLTFFNQFDLGQIKRFYTIKHDNLEVIRAWQGHKYEKKWFHVVNGSFKLVLVKPDDWSKPSPELPYEKFEMHDIDSKILYVPGGVASGFKATSPNSKMVVFSDFSLDQSIADDYRFDKNLWYKW